MWDRSNSPQRVRTAACSARMPLGYWTGMSQPAKSTIRPPSWRWRAARGVSSSSEGETIAKYPRQHGRDARHLLGKQQYAHADQQHAADAFDREHVRPDAAHDAQRAVHGEPGQQKRNAQSERIHEQQQHAGADRVLL